MCWPSLWLCRPTFDCPAVAVVWMRHYCPWQRLEMSSIFTTSEWEMIMNEFGRDLAQVLGQCSPTSWQAGSAHSALRHIAPCVNPDQRTLLEPRFFESTITDLLCRQMLRSNEYESTTKSRLVLTALVIAVIGKALYLRCCTAPSLFHCYSL